MFIQTFAQAIIHFESHRGSIRVSMVRLFPFLLPKFGKQSNSCLDQSLKTGSVFHQKGGSMQWCIWPLEMLWKVMDVGKWMTHEQVGLERKKQQTLAGKRMGKRARFYANIATSDIRVYQKYLNRAFLLNPSLEFEPGDVMLGRLFGEAESTAGLSVFDLELMRMQYVLADKGVREVYRKIWAVTVINAKESTFFPSPWEILTALFSSPSLAGENPFDSIGEFA